MSTAFSKFKFSWKWLDQPAVVIASTLFIFILSQALAITIVAAGYKVLHPHTTMDNLDLEDISVLAQLIFVLLFIGLYILLVKRFLSLRGLKLASIGLKRKPKIQDVTKGFLGYGAFLALLFIINSLLTVVFPELDNNQKQDVGFNVLNTSLDYVLAFIALVILPPIGEEILVRGYLYSGLRKYWKIIPAAIMTSLIFGIAHLQLGEGTAVLWAAGVSTFTLSLVLVYLREKTGALYAGMLVHCLNNLLAFFVHFHS
jgi:membrane protease YdiL (CAAX protease family)